MITSQPKLQIMSKHFEILPTPIPDLHLIQRNPIGDGRGYLERLFCAEELRVLVQAKPIIQINHTLTSLKGTLRGMHAQRQPFAEIKLIQCLRGEVYDVAIDLRPSSPTYLHWHAEILSATNHRTMVIPEGFAHGFQTLADDCELVYFHTAPYHAEAEVGLNATDPKIGVEWPIEITCRSERDQALPMLEELTQGVFS